MKQGGHLTAVIREFHARGIPVSLFVEPERGQIEAAREVGADMIELHTGEYANAQTEAQQQKLLESIREAAAYGKSIGLGVNAGHGLNYVNSYAIAKIAEIDEVSIGHAIVSRAVFVGLTEAVREMLRIVKRR